MMQFINEDDAPEIKGLDPNLGAEEDEIRIGRLPDGTFVTMKGKDAVPVPESV